MTELLMARLAANDGVISTSELNGLGYDRHAIAKLVDDKTLRRVRPRAYVHEAAFADAQADLRYAAEVRSVLRTMPRYAATHLSAAVVWSMPAVVSSRTWIHIARQAESRPRHVGRVHVHPTVDEDETTTHRGITLVKPGVAIVQAATESVRDGLIAADGAVRAGLVTHDTLDALAETSGSVHVRRVANLCSRLSESAGESWSRLVFAGLGIPQPEQQVEIFDHDGSHVARVDFLFRAQRVVVEFDGDVKYGGADGRESLIQEKRREDRLRALGYRVVRLTWADLRNPARVVALLGFGLAA